MLFQLLLKISKTFYLLSLKRFSSNSSIIVCCDWLKHRKRNRSGKCWSCNGYFARRWHNQEWEIAERRLLMGSRIINQFVPSVMSELVWMLFVVVNVTVKFIINAHFYLHISYITFLRRKGSIHAQIALLPMFPI